MREHLLQHISSTHPSIAATLTDILIDSYDNPQLLDFLQNEQKMQEIIEEHFSHPASPKND